MLFLEGVKCFHVRRRRRLWQYGNERSCSNLPSLEERPEDRKEFLSMARNHNGRSSHLYIPKDQFLRDTQTPQESAAHPHTRSVRMLSEFCTRLSHCLAIMSNAGMNGARFGYWTYMEILDGMASRLRVPGTPEYGILCKDTARQDSRAPPNCLYNQPRCGEVCPRGKFDNVE